ncbi:MAG: hypothetical protein Q7U56_05310, partial [Humidesulfovibrio sp.]|nr:hypothetical protein [Humidesulfovibrio sp.]
MQIKNTSDLIEYFIHVMHGQIEPTGISISDSFVGTMHFRGSKWKGRVDKDVAIFLLDTQKQIRKTYKKAARINTNHVTVGEKSINFELEVKDGTTTIVAILEKLLAVPLLNISSEHALYALIVISCTILGMKIVDTKAELLRQAKDEETKQKLIKMHQTVISDIQKSLKPAVSFVKRMHNDDTLELNHSNTELTREEAIQHFSIECQPESLSFIVDDIYDVTNVHLKTTKVTLEVRGIRFTASIEDLSEGDKIALSSAID